MLAGLSGKKVVLYRSVRRLPEGKRWSRDAVMGVKVTPWAYDVSVKVDKRVPQLRRRYMMRSDVERHGPTLDC